MTVAVSDLTGGPTLKYRKPKTRSMRTGVLASSLRAAGVGLSTRRPVEIDYVEFARHRAST